MSKMFKVGDGVNYNIGSDVYPGTIVKVSATGKTVWVQDDDAAVTKPAEHYGDPVDYMFMPNPNGRVTKFTQRQDGIFRQVGGRWGALHKGRRKYQDPHF